MRIRALFTKPAFTLGLVEQAPLFTASSFEVILAGHRDILPLGLSSGTSGSGRISLILLHERTRRRIRLCHLCTLVDIVTESAIVSIKTLPVGFHCQQTPKVLCSRCFVSWLHSWFVDSARYFFSPSFSICDNQVLFSSDESPGHTIPIRPQISQTLVLYNPSKMSLDGRHWQKIPSFRTELLDVVISKNNSE